MTSSRRGACHPGTVIGRSCYPFAARLSKRGFYRHDSLHRKRVQRAAIVFREVVRYQVRYAFPDAGSLVDVWLEDPKRPDRMRRLDLDSYRAEPYHRSIQTRHEPQHLDFGLACGKFRAHPCIPIPAAVQKGIAVELQLEARRTVTGLVNFDARGDVINSKSVMLHVVT